MPTSGADAGLHRLLHAPQTSHCTPQKPKLPSLQSIWSPFVNEHVGFHVRICLALAAPLPAHLDCPGVCHIYRKPNYVPLKLAKKPETGLSAVTASNEKQL